MEKRLGRGGCRGGKAGSMISYLARRLVTSLIVIIGVSIFIFLLAAMWKGRPGAILKRMALRSLIVDDNAIRARRGHQCGRAGPGHRRHRS